MIKIYNEDKSKQIKLKLLAIVLYAKKALVKFVSNNKLIMYNIPTIKKTVIGSIKNDLKLFMC